MQRLGAGREAEIFAWEEGRVLRLAHRPEHAPLLAHEALAMRAARAAGAPVPAVFEQVEVEGRPGLVMERRDGGDDLQLLQRRPWTVTRIGRRLGELHARIHAVAAPEGLPEVRELVAALLASPAVPAALRERAERTLAALPRGDRLCHGDFHPANVLGGDTVVDWTSAARGDPAADVARTRVLIEVAVLPGEPPAVIRRLDRIGRRLLLAAYLRAYRARRPLDLALTDRWVGVLAAARVGEQIDGEREAALALAARYA